MIDLCLWFRSQAALEHIFTQQYLGLILNPRMCEENRGAHLRDDHLI